MLSLTFEKCEEKSQTRFRRGEQPLIIKSFSATSAVLDHFLNKHSILTIQLTEIILFLVFAVTEQLAEQKENSEIQHKLNYVDTK